MSLDNLSLNQSAQNSQFIRQAKLNSGAVNNELLKNIEILDSENTQLKAALGELQEDLRDKENSIEESHKIITKLKDEYSKLIKEYQNLEQINNDLISENELNKKSAEGFKRANETISKLQKQTNDLINENNALKKENNAMKNKLISNNSSSNKKEQDLKDKELIITDLKEKADNWVLMIKDRENLINEQSKKIKELNEIILRKDDQLKLMVNFSKEINKENKSNVAELTKQAVKTIKVFYNTLNNSGKNNIDSGYRVEFKNTATTFENFEPTLKNKKTCFLLEDATQGMMYIPNDLKSISKEFLMDMNFKTELIKSELYSSLIRETQFVKFLDEIFSKLNIKDTENIKNISKKVIELTSNFGNILKENNKLKSENRILLQNQKNSDLFLKKFKENVSNNMNKLKEKYSYLTNNIDNKVQNIKNNNIIVKEKARKDGEKLKAENLVLKQDNQKLREDIDELRRLFETQKDNDKIYKSLEKNEPLYKSNNFEETNKRMPWNTMIQNIPEISFNYIHSNNTINRFPRTDLDMNLINTINKDNDKNDIDIGRYKERKTQKYNRNNDNDNNQNYNKKYHKKKKEINNLKNEIDRVKDEINNIMLNSDNPNFNISDNYLSIPEKENNTDLNNNINDIKMKTYTIQNSDINNHSNYSGLNKKVSDLQKMLSIEKNKNSKLEKENISLKQYINNLIDDIEKLKMNKKRNIINNNVFTPKFFIKMFYNINPKVFSSSELKKYYKIYNTQDIETIFEIFSKTCQCLKRQIYETNFEVETANTDMEDNYMNMKNVVIDSSYRLVNERIMKLKKLEFDFINLSEFVKNYLVSQETMVKIIFNSDNNIIQFEPIERLFNLFEDCLNFKIDEMNDNVIFQRKLLIKILKNQKNCLGLSLESLTEQ
jgi:hypothetical protein